MAGQDNQSTIEGTIPAQAPSDARNRVEPDQLRPTRLVCIGGGTGLPVVLRGLARKVAPSPGNPGVDLTAIVAMSDDGGSSGRLRRMRGLLPPGDIRNCLVALAGEKAGLKQLFQHRFDGARGIGGHAVGNLLLAALTELEGDFLKAVEASARMLNARGRVLPCTLAPTHLVAELEDDSQVFGERKIARARSRVRRVSLDPPLPPPGQGVIEAIQRADLITIGPGSLYSSVLPNLLVDGVAEALRETKALKVLISNLMTQPGETDGMDCVDHTRAVIAHVGPVVDVVLINARPPAPEVMQRYLAKGQAQVTVDRRGLIALGVIPVEADLLKEGARIRHDSGKLARCVLKLARSGL
ncbi:MAG: YvcK family protein [Myxococcaceae bacterium]|nr:YvcK family protein [Myxococcaceae bacterium]